MPEWLSKLWILQSTCTPRASCDSALLILSHAFCTLSTSQRAGFVKRNSFKKPCHSGVRQTEVKGSNKKLLCIRFLQLLFCLFQIYSNDNEAVAALLMTYQKPRKTSWRALTPERQFVGDLVLDGHCAHWAACPARFPQIPWIWGS